MALFTKKKDGSETIKKSSAAPGPCAPGSTIGHPIVLNQGHIGIHAYPDPDGGVRFVAWADLPASAGDSLASHPDTPPHAWPAPTRSGTSVWDGTLDEFPACNRVRLPAGSIAAWRADDLGVAAAAIDPTGKMSPIALAESLAVAAGEQPVAPGDYERVWLQENLRILGVEAPDNERPDRLRAGLAHLLGYRSVDAFTADPLHNPTPTLLHGAPLWRRALPADRRPLAPLASAVISHDVTGAFKRDGAAGPVEIIQSGALLSQRLRRSAGMTRGVGKSEDADEKVGLSRMVFFHLAPYWPQMPTAFVWTDVMTALGWCGSIVLREDPSWFPVPFRAEIKADWQDLIVTDLAEVAQFVADGHVPQVAVPGGLPVIGPTAPTAMIVRDPWSQQQCADAYTRHAMSSLGGQSLTDAIRVDPLYIDRQAA